jgi:hypothetical protein
MESSDLAGFGAGFKEEFTIVAHDPRTGEAEVPMATQFRVADTAPVEQRRERRRPVAIAVASVRHAANEPQDATLKDLSIYGCRIESRGDHRAGQSVRLRLNGSAPVPAKVVWSADGVAGCRFDEPIDRALLRALVLTMA